MAGPDDWAGIAHVAGSALPGAEVVKIVVDRRSEPWVPHFLDTPRFQHHVDFCRLLDPRSDARFDQVMYRDPDRPFVLLTMTRLPGAADDGGGDPGGDDLWWLEMWPGDDLAAGTVARVVGQLREATFLGERLRVRASSGDQLRRWSEVPGLGPLLDQGEVWRGVGYQGLTTGVAHGRLRVLRASDLPAGLADLTAYDVVVSEAIPLEIGPVAGLVTAELQTPLAHVAVLSANRGTPNAAVVGAHDLESVLALEGRWVRLEVERSHWSLTEAPEETARGEAEQRLAAMRAGAPRLDVDLARRGLPDLGARVSREVGVVGAKSAALARLQRDRRLRRYLAPGFTVPIATFHDHVRADPAVAPLLARLADGGGPVTELLAQVRGAVGAVPVDPALVEGILAGIRGWRGDLATGGEVILRSSSNCEDLPGFNGAGLADSVRVPAPVTGEAVAGALREVWASLWSDRGYAERQAFGIDPTRVAMAVLVQPVVPHAAHVVAVTTNPVRPGAIPAYLLNLLPAGGLVTDQAGAGAEQLLVIDDDPACAEVLALAAGRSTSLLGEDAIGVVRDTLKRVDRLVRREAGARASAADVELLLLEDGAPRPLVLLQARPYG